MRPGCSPVADHAGVVVEPLVEPAPVVSYQVQVKVVGSHWRFPVAQLLEGALAEKQRGTPCNAKPHDYPEAYIAQSLRHIGMGLHLCFLKLLDIVGAFRVVMTSILASE